MMCNSNKVDYRRRRKQNIIQNYNESFMGCLLMLLIILSASQFNFVSSFNLRVRPQPFNTVFQIHNNLNHDLIRGEYTSYYYRSRITKHYLKGTENDQEKNIRDTLSAEESTSAERKSTTKNIIIDETKQTQIKVKRVTKLRKAKEWNTSIFPSNIPTQPVAKEFIPQAYIQTLAGIIGIFSGISVSGFKLSIDSIRQFFYENSADGIIDIGVPIFLIPVLGGVGVAILSLVGEFSPGVRGVLKEVDDDSFSVQLERMSTLSDKESINVMNGVIDDTVQTTARTFRKSLAAILTLGTGNSLGPEGPGVEIGAAVSRIFMRAWPQDLFPYKDTTEHSSELYAERLSRNRLLLACGAAAGVSSGFNAPLSGVYFALEVVQAALPTISIPTYTQDSNGISTESNSSKIVLPQQSFSSNQGSIAAILISSILAALVARVLLGNELALELLTYEIKTPLAELPLYIGLGISCGVVSVIFTEVAKLFKAIFDGKVGSQTVRDSFSAIPAAVLPIIGGFACGIVGLFYPEVLFFGYETLNRLLSDDNRLSTELLLSLLAAKTFATAVAASSGLVGGTFAPSLFLGGMVGASFHNIACETFTAFNIPETISTSSGLLFDLAGVPIYSIVGAASVLAAIFRAPLTASLLLFEITRDYDVLLPLLASAGVASLVSDILEAKVEQAIEQQY